MKELLEKWRNRLAMFKKHVHVAKNMDPNTAMGVQHGRVLTLETCIKELEQEVEKLCHALQLK